MRISRPQPNGKTIRELGEYSTAKRTNVEVGTSGNVRTGPTEGTSWSAPTGITVKPTWTMMPSKIRREGRSLSPSISSPSAWVSSHQDAIRRHVGRWLVVGASGIQGIFDDFDTAVDKSREIDGRPLVFKVPEKSESRGGASRGA